MDEYLKKYIGYDYYYTVPSSLVKFVYSDYACQIVVAWYVMITQTIHRHVSLSSVRSQIDPSCEWDRIGHMLGTLFDINGLKKSDHIHQQISTIGKGNMSVILSHQGNGELFAIKQQLFHRGQWEIPSHVVSECYALDRIHSKRWAPKILYRHVSRDMLQIGMEYIPMSMKQMVRFATKNITFIRIMFRHLITAVYELHLTGLAHRDIKPDNIRFRSDGTLVLIDYDSCEAYDGPHVFRTAHVCTSLYRDPYLFIPNVDISTYDYTKLDAFSCGAVFLYMLLGGKHAFYGQSEIEIMNAMINALHPSRDVLYLIPSTTRSKLIEIDKQLLYGLLHTQPDKRMSIAAAYTLLQNI